MRVVLQIAVGGDDQPPARMGEAGGKGGGLSEVAAEPDHPQPRIGRLQPCQDREAVVRAAIVDNQDLVGAAEGGQRLGELAMELDQRGRLVADRDDDGQLNHLVIWTFGYLVIDQINDQ